MTRKFTAIDLFAGSGGLSTGLEYAGFSVLFANEIESSYSESLAANHPSTEVMVDDIRSVDPTTVRKALGIRRGELDLLAGGPPCQGFSVNAPIRSNDDQRNNLFRNYLQFVDAFQPKVVLIENVPGIVSFSKGETVSAILNSLNELGYSSSVKILFAPNFGVPQIRWRTIFLATRLNVNPLSLFPVPTHHATGNSNFSYNFKGESLKLPNEYIEDNAMNPHVTVWDAIGDLPSIGNGGETVTGAYANQVKSEYQKFMRRGSLELTNHRCSKLGPINLRRLPFVPPGGSWRDIPHNLLPKGMQRARRSDHTKRYGRLAKAGLASTILTKCDPHWGTYIHPIEDRVISVREAARLQSFPDKCIFFGSMTEQYEQVGNAVPPIFARAIGEQIVDVLNKLDLGLPIIDGLVGKRRQEEFFF